MEETYGVASAAYASHEKIGQTPLFLQNHLAGFAAYYRLKISDYHGKRMRSQR